ncbi:cobalt-zinc-cadmium resistance protein CzcC precursor [Janthinobacterium sp. HH106]|nr:cobalt-zinc-cadmium resistance protein CzcC precursor [Janthinobacterium sp. HH106]
MRIRISFFIVATVLATTAVAQSVVENGTALRLGDAVAKARLQAPALQGADAAVRAAEANVQLSGLRPNPTLSVEAENVMGSGRYTGFGGGEKTVSFSIPLELGGKRQARVGVARAESIAAGIGAKASQADLTLQVTEAFVSLAASERHAQIAKTSHELAERAFHAARERVRAGKASPIEEQRADVLRINAEVRLGKAVRAVELARSNVVRLTGVAKPFAIASPWFEHVERSDVPAASGAGLAIVAADAEVAAAAARIVAARSDRVPDVTLTAGMRRFGETSDKAAVIGLSIPLPLFNPGTAVLSRTRAEYDRAVATRRAAGLAFDQSMEQANAEVADAVEAARAANGPALAAAEEAARIARLGYREGKFPQLELIEAERSLAETRQASVDALTALHTARARLARLQGSTSPIYKD